MEFSTNRDVQSHKIAKIMKRLHDSALQFQLKDCSITGGTIEKRKSNFHKWIDTLRQMMYVEWRFSALLARYPFIECQNISTTSNMALAGFLFTKMKARSREQAQFGLDDHLDGVALLLQQNFGGTTIDCTNTMQKILGYYVGM
ncbi:hypothetical protein IV203_005037 [Nitzschia inconspicua]|uniref:Uncharacterized protein n=1 Tax=Nitzschia inconspicua TaxID=303405 RepID=A0A9K3PG34_9STRA|nr:hypothetical protein IV203_005037 [Nitzschia inconspicua]